MVESVARTYGSYLTYQQMAEEVQRAAGIATGVPFRHWIGRVLGEIAAEQQRSRPDEPFLTALVVRADGTIGDGYAIPVEERDGVVPADLEMHAAEERLRCYRYFGAELRRRRKGDADSRGCNSPVERSEELASTASGGMPELLPSTSCHGPLRLLRFMICMPRPSRSANTV